MDLGVAQQEKQRPGPPDVDKMHHCTASLSLSFSMSNGELKITSSPGNMVTMENHVQKCTLYSLSVSAQETRHSSICRVTILFKSATFPLKQDVCGTVHLVKL